MTNLLPMFVLQHTFNSPVIANERGELFCARNERSYEITRFVARNDAGRFVFDHDQGFQSRPLMPLLQRLNVCKNSDPPRFETAMIFFHGFVLIDFQERKTKRFLFLKKRLDIFPQRSLIAFKRQNIEVAGKICPVFASHLI